MKRLINIAVVMVMSLAGMQNASARLTAAGAFADAPAPLFPLLDKNARLDMIDYFNSGSATPTQNALQGKSRVTALTPDDIKIAMTDASSYQISILPYGNDSIIAVIQTVAAPAHDSHISFYNRRWEKMSAPLFKAPDLDAWLTSDGDKDASNVAALIPFMLAKYDYDNATAVLTLTNNLQEFLSPDVYKMVSASIHPVLKYRWTGKMMEPMGK
ncbi:MAG TPA: DUF3256 family protein [Muribaculum sp.]|uniref:DUF3256 family protein n=1 Tax=Heminiphilus faecis TaxID=2601703 RepID=A0ABV4D150_9BACT|nr:DUF3256 family protein [Heminiphilus faecis]RLT77205.1 DUF3256 family protein [bacterium J10(2018)]HRF69589.1 DUF3256 family protein [Muribaculum sp.]